MTSCISVLCAVSFSKPDFLCFACSAVLHFAFVHCTVTNANRRVLVKPFLVMLIMSFMFSTYRDPYPSEQLSRVVDVVAVGYRFLFRKTHLIHLQQQVCGAVSKRRFKTDLQLGPLNFVQKIPFSLETGVSIGVTTRWRSHSWHYQETYISEVISFPC